MNESHSKEERLTLELLDVIERDGDISQRHLASQMGVALGLANLYLKRCVKKGLVKIKEAPANRYFYYLTPKGFAEKSRLTARFLSSSLTFYRQSVESLSDLYDSCENNGRNRLLFCGVSDLAEIALLRARETKLTVEGIYDPSHGAREFLGRPIFKNWHMCPKADAYVITGLGNPLGLFKEVASYLGDSDRVLVPRVLGIEPRQAVAETNG
ncbi:winged helix-turn-helix transcriptional regulator [Pseudomonadota bacterium]